MEASVWPNWGVNNVFPTVAFQIFCRLLALILADYIVRVRTDFTFWCLVVTLRYLVSPPPPSLRLERNRKCRLCCMTIRTASYCCGNTDGYGQRPGNGAHPVSRCAVFCFSKPPPGLVHLKHVICIVCKFLRRYNMCTQAQPMHCWCVRCNIGETIPRLSIKDTVLTTEPSNLFTARTFYCARKTAALV